MAEKSVTENSSAEIGGVDFTGLNRAVDDAITEIDRLRETNAQLIAALKEAYELLSGGLRVDYDAVMFSLDRMRALIDTVEGAQ